MLTATSWLLLTNCLWAEPKPSPYIYLEGEARDSQFGACMVQGPTTAVFLKGIEEWMPGMAGNGRSSMYFIVGKLVESFDLATTTNPAEVKKKILVPPDGDEHMASHRWNITSVEGMYQADPFAHPFRDHFAMKLDWTSEFSAPATPDKEKFYLELKVPYRISQSDLNSAIEQLNKAGFVKVAVKFSGNNYKD